jgi:hypothetical protein
VRDIVINADLNFKTPNAQPKINVGEQDCYRENALRKIEEIIEPEPQQSKECACRNYK